MLSVTLQPLTSFTDDLLSAISNFLRPVIIEFDPGQLGSVAALQLELAMVPLQIIAAAVGSYVLRLANLITRTCKQEDFWLTLTATETQLWLKIFTTQLTLTATSLQSSASAQIIYSRLLSKFPTVNLTRLRDIFTLFVAEN